MNPAISDYALIGNCETAALVSRTGSMDWFCSPRFDSPACFAALLGSAENGRWLIAPHAKAKVSRRYRPHTLILETEFETSSGRAVLIDFMPMNEINPRVIRIVHGIRGRVSMQMDLVIRFDYGLSVPWVKQEHGALVAVSGPNRLVLHSSVPVEGKGLHSVSKFTVSAGKSVTFELQHGSSFHPQPRGKAPHASLEKTQRFWHHWNSRCNYKGPFAQDVERSLMTLKALIYDPTGGMVAAPTTSVPEKPGGDWNWDYRYCWVRDATFTLLAFIHAGYHEEARRWNKWLMRSAAGSADQMQVMYGITGERLLNEWQVPWLTGYNGAKPVRVGNAASEQLQLDVFGELADALHQARTSIQENGGDFDLQVALLRRLKQIWREPDNGIWEIRGKKQHYTHSKVMAWVAFDRTIRSAERLNVNCPLDEWRAVRQAIHEDVCRRGYNPRLQSFVRTYGSQDLDASLLLVPIVGFLPRERSACRRYRAHDREASAAQGLRNALRPDETWPSNQHARRHISPVHVLAGRLLRIGGTPRRSGADPATASQSTKRCRPTLRRISAGQETPGREFPAGVVPRGAHQYGHQLAPREEPGAPALHPQPPRDHLGSATVQLSLFAEFWRARTDQREPCSRIDQRGPLRSSLLLSCPSTFNSLFESF